MSTAGFTGNGLASQAPLPPIVPGLPLMGSVYALANDALGFLLTAYHRFGPIFRLRALGQSFTVLAGPDANQFMVREGEQHFRSREFWEGMNREAGAGNSLISSDGEVHARLRKLFRPGFSRSAIDRHYPEVVSVVREALADWRPGESRAVTPAMERIITEQLGRIVVGHGPGEYLPAMITFVRLALMARVTRQRPRVVLYTPRYRRAKRRAMALGQAVIDEHRANPPGDGREPDLIDDLLAASAADPELMPESDLLLAALSPYIAGLDTAMSTTAFMLYAIHHDTSLLERCRAEARTLFLEGVPRSDQVRKLDVLHRTVLETLRRYPIAPGIQRTATHTFEFGGYRVDEGTSVLIATAVPHFLPELHPDPYRFDIDRYLPGRNEHKAPGGFAPFGLGAHTCLGAGLAEVQIMLTVATLLNDAEMELDPPGYTLRTRSAPTQAPEPGFRLHRLA
jgi:cytochrome P450